MPRPETVKRWSERLQRFERTQMTIAQFCKAEGVSQPSFYNWKRKLSVPEGKVTSSAARFVSVALHAKSDHPDSLAARTSTNIELPGGIRIRIETPVQTQQANPGEASS